MNRLARNILARKRARGSDVGAGADGDPAFDEHELSALAAELLATTTEAEIDRIVHRVVSRTTHLGASADTAPLARSLQMVGRALLPSFRRGRPTGAGARGLVRNTGAAPGLPRPVLGNTLGAITRGLLEQESELGGAPPGGHADSHAQGAAERAFALASRFVRLAGEAAREVRGQAGSRARAASANPSSALLRAAHRLGFLTSSPGAFEAQ